MVIDYVRTVSKTVRGGWSFF